MESDNANTTTNMSQSQIELQNILSAITRYHNFIVSLHGAQTVTSTDEPVVEKNDEPFYLTHEAIEAYANLPNTKGEIRKFKEKNSIKKSLTLIMNLGFPVNDYKSIIKAVDKSYKHDDESQSQSETNDFSRCPDNGLKWLCAFLNNYDKQRFRKEVRMFVITRKILKIKRLDNAEPSDPTIPEQIMEKITETIMWDLYPNTYGQGESTSLKILCLTLQILGNGLRSDIAFLSALPTDNVYYDNGVIYRKQTVVKTYNVFKEQDEIVLPEYLVPIMENLKLSRGNNRFFFKDEDDDDKNVREKWNRRIMLATASLGFENLGTRALRHCFVKKGLVENNYDTMAIIENAERLGHSVMVHLEDYGM